MSEINDVSRVVEVTWPDPDPEKGVEGKVWKLPRQNYGTEGAYARFLRLGALRDLDALAGAVSTRAYDAGMKAITDRFAARAYDWNGEVWRQSLDSDACLREALWLMITQIPDQRGLTRGQMEQFWKAKRNALVDAWNE